MRAFALALVLSVPALAQDAPVALTPGHADLMTDAVSPSSQTYAVAIVQPMTQSLGTISETIAIADDGTVTAYQAVDIVAMGNAQTMRDTTRYAWPSLAPISNVSHNTEDGDIERVAFDGLNVSGSMSDGGAAPLPFDIDLDAPVFGPGVGQLLVQLIPLREGYAATYPIFSAEDRLEEGTITVVGREDVEVAGETVSAWVVERGGDIQTRTYYLHPDTRAILKMTFAPGPGYLVEMVPTDG